MMWASCHLGVALFNFFLSLFYLTSIPESFLCAWACAGAQDTVSTLEALVGLLRPSED